jgi:hypothetical protein
MTRQLFVCTIPIGLHNVIHHNAILKLCCQRGTKEEESKE